MLANLLRQLLEHLQHIPQEVQSLYGSRFVDQDQKNSTIEQWIALIELLCKKFCRTFLIVDALDECPELDDNSNEARAKMISSILRLSKSAQVFVTSRPSVDVAAKIPECMTLRIQARYSDLRSYLKARKTEHTALKKIIVQDPALEKHLKDTICRKSNGMYVLLGYGCCSRKLTSVGFYSHGFKLIHWYTRQVPGTYTEL